MTKLCSKCGNCKPLDDFAIRRDVKCGYVSWCKSCVNARSCARYKDNAASICESTDRYRRNHVSQYRNYSRQWRARQDLEVLRESQRVAYYLRKGRDIEGLRRNWRDKRLTRINFVSQVDESFSAEDATVVYLMFNNQCFRCGFQDKLEMDHHYPLSRGYGLSITNAVLLCKSCNSSKGAKMPEEFYTQEELSRLADIMMEQAQ